jgi:hypothetical protein
LRYERGFVARKRCAAFFHFLFKGASKLISGTSRCMEVNRGGSILAPVEYIRREAPLIDFPFFVRGVLFSVCGRRCAAIASQLGFHYMESRFLLFRSFSKGARGLVTGASRRMGIDAGVDARAPRNNTPASSLGGYTLRLDNDSPQLFNSGP